MRRPAGGTSCFYFPLRQAMTTWCSNHALLLALLRMLPSCSHNCTRYRDVVLDNSAQISQISTYAELFAVLGNLPLGWSIISGAGGIVYSSLRRLWSSDLGSKQTRAAACRF